MADANLYAAWIGMLLGGIAGAIQGLWFHREAWLGGYGSWPRRMLRLGHISFFGIALINLAFALTVRSLDIADGVVWPSRLLIAGAVAMPSVCYLSAYRKAFRHLFCIPALSVIVATGLFLARLGGG